MKVRLLAAGGLLTLLPLVVFCVLWLYQSRHAEQIALDGTVELANSDLKHVSDMIADQAVSYDQLLRQEVSVLLKVAGSVGNRLGLPSAEGIPIEWKARNQFTKAEVETKLPRFHYGRIGLSENRDPKVRAPFVDDVRDLTTATCTVFQRMNEAGDMLRVSTSVIAADGKRATGTFIPAVNPDGKPNPVVSKVLSGETFVGRAFVVDSWYMSAYTPIRSLKGQTIGMLYVGIPEKLATTYLQQMLGKMRFGETGRVVVFNATGANRGHPVWESGQAIVKTLAQQRVDSSSLLDVICDKAVKLAPAGTEVVEYTTAGRARMIRITYYKAWDWVIGLDTARDEVFASALRINKANSESQQIQLGAGSVALIVVALTWWGIASQISGQLQRMTTKVKEAARQVGSSTEHLQLQSRNLERSAEQQVEALARSSELGQTVSGKSVEVSNSAGRAASLMASVREATLRSDAQLKEMVESMHAITGSSSRIAHIIKMIDEIALQTRMLALNAAIEAAHAGDAGRGFGVVAEQVGLTARRCSEAAAETSRLIQECIDVSAKGRDRLDVLTNGVLAMSADLSSAAEIVGTVAVMSSEQTHTLRETAESLQHIGDATRSVGDSVQGSAGAIGQLSGQRGALDNVIAELESLCLGKK